MTEPSKAAYIMELDDGERTPREIAEIVYGEATEARMAYVRVVRKRQGGCRSENDRRYVSSPLGRATTRKRFAERYHSDPEFRLKCLRHAMKWQRDNAERYNAYKRDYMRERRLIAKRAQS